MEWYLLAKSLHIIAIISWMVALLYMPRLFAYHTQAVQGGEADKIFQIMERKLLRYIMTPAMIASYIFGIWLITIIGMQHPWLHIKLSLVLCLSAMHGMMAKYHRDFVLAKNRKSQKFFRIFNEVPTIIMIIIIFLVVYK